MTRLWLFLADLARKITEFFLRRAKSSGNIDNDVVLEYQLLLKENGDVFLETECYDFSPESIQNIALLLYFLNSGKLGELHIQSINTWAEGNPEYAEKIQQLLILWQTMAVQELEMQTLSESEPLISPLTALEPDQK